MSSVKRRGEVHVQPRRQPVAMTPATGPATADHGDRPLARTFARRSRDSSKTASSSAAGAQPCQ
eukprot:2849199-Pyramimonas_sp.AAC.2